MTTNITGSNLPTLASDQIKSIKGGYGQNCPQPSSLCPGETVSSALDITPPGGDPSKALIASRGVKTADTLPEMAKGGRPTTFGMKSPNINNAKVPGAVTWKD
jgi:hypothetical protein